MRENCLKYQKLLNFYSIFGMDSQEVILQQCHLSQERVLVTSVCVCFTCRCLVGVSGNMLEWCLPKDMDLDGVEFKAIASGSHRVTTDFM